MGDRVSKLAERLAGVEATVREIDKKLDWILKLVASSVVGVLASAGSLIALLLRHG